MRRRTILAFLVLLIGAFAFAAAGCGGDDDDGEAGGTGAGDTGDVSLPPVTALPSASCTDIEYEGEGDPQALIATDLPLQGSSRTQTLQINRAVRQVLQEAGWKAGNINIGFQSCDDATAQAGKWDPGKCSQNANSYAENQSLLMRDRHVQLWLCRDHHPGAQPGTRRRHGDALAGEHLRLPDRGRSGCTDDEPDKYYPSGSRNYARVVANDAYQGAAVAEFAQEQGTTKLYILNDKEAYGLGVATNTQQRRGEPRHRGRRLRRLGPEGVELRGHHEQGEAVRSGRPVPRRPHRRERRPGDQGQGQGPGAERRCREALHARRLHDAADDRRGGRREHAQRVLLDRGRSYGRVRVPGGRGLRHDVPGDARRSARRPVRHLRRPSGPDRSSTRSRTPTGPARASSNRCSPRR